MRRRNLTMGEMSEYMAQEYGTANFARKSSRRKRRKGGSSLTSNAVVGRSLTGRLARGGALAAAIGLGGTKRGRGLVKSGYGRAADALGVAAYQGRGMAARASNKIRGVKSLAPAGYAARQSAAGGVSSLIDGQGRSVRRKG